MLLPLISRILLQSHIKPKQYCKFSLSFIIDFPIQKLIYDPEKNANISLSFIHKLFGFFIQAVQLLQLHSVGLGLIAVDKVIKLYC